MTSSLTHEECVRLILTSFPESSLQNNSLAEELLSFLKTYEGGRETCMPTKRVDAVWRMLILETITYRRICDHVAGCFLHRSVGERLHEAEPSNVETDEFGVPIVYRKRISQKVSHIGELDKSALANHRSLKSNKDVLVQIVECFMNPHANLGDKSRVSVLAEEVLGFLTLKCMLNDVHCKYLISPPSDIDQGWHELITNTKLYEEICRFLGCDTIIHHSMHQDGAGSRESRLVATLEGLLKHLSSEEQSKVTFAPSEGDWVGYEIPVAFRLLLKKA